MRKRIEFRALNRPNVKLLATALLCGMLGIAGCGSKADPPAADKQPARPAGPQMPAPLVTVARAIARDVPVYLDEIGKSQALETVTVTPQVAGRITERLFQDGAQIKKDQPLFTIDPRPYQAQLDAAQAQLAQSRAALDLATTQLKMYASIADTKAVSQLDYETKKNNVALDQAQVQAAEAAVENAKLNLEYCHIRSPLDGRAGARLVDVGNVVQANMTALLSIQRIDPIYATLRSPNPICPKCGGRWLRARCGLWRAFPPILITALARGNWSFSTPPCRVARARSTCAPPFPIRIRISGPASS